MKRDMDLIRAILLALEEQSAYPRAINLEIEGYDKETISFHIMLLDEAGLIEAFDATTHGSLNWMPQRLTWDGYEFLEAARNEKVWKKFKNKLEEEGLSLPIKLAQIVLIELLKSQLNSVI